MIELQYRIGTLSFRDEESPTWGTRSTQILDALARWGRDGWRISRLNASACVGIRAKGFCLLLERPLASSAKSSSSSRRLSHHPFAA